MLKAVPLVQSNGISLISMGCIGAFCKKRMSPKCPTKRLVVLGIFAQGIAYHFCFQITGLGGPRLQILLNQLCHFGIMWWDDLSAIAPVEFVSLDATKRKAKK